MSVAGATPSLPQVGVAPRRCSDCGVVSRDFSPKGFYCRPCTVQRTKEWRARNPKSRRANDVAYRDRHRAELREKNLAYYHARMVADPETVRANRRAWARTPKGAIYNRQARHVRRGAAPDREAREYMRVLLGDPCAYCGGPGGEIDHIRPLSLDGDGGWENLTSACRRCNAAKHDGELLPLLVARSAA